MSISVKKVIGFSLGTWVSFALSFAIAPLITYIISPDEFGKLSLVQISQSVLFYIISIGLDQAFVRFFHNNKEDGNYFNFFVNCLIPTLILFAFTSLILFLFYEEVNFAIVESKDIGYSLVLAMTLSLFVTLLQTFGMLYVRMQKQGYFYSMLQILAAVLNYCGLFLFLHFGQKDFLIFIYSQTIGNAVSLILILGYLFRTEKKISLSIDRKMIITLIGFGLPFLPVFFIDYLFNNSDKYFLRWYADFKELGLYSFAYKIGSAFNLIQAGFILYWVPFTQEAYIEDSKNVTYYNPVFRLVNAGIGICIIGFICFKEILFFIIQKEYYEAVYYVPYILLSPYFLTLSEITCVGVNLKLKTKLHMLINFITLVFNLSMGFVLISNFGIKGAALNIGLTYMVFFALRSYVGHRLYPVKISWNYFIVNTVYIVLIIALDGFLRLELKYLAALFLPLVLVLYYLNGNLYKIAKALIKKEL